MPCEEVKIKREADLPSRLPLTFEDLESFVAEVRESISEGFEPGAINVVRRMQTGFASIDVTLSRPTGAR